MQLKLQNSFPAWPYINPLTTCNEYISLCDIYLPLYIYVIEYVDSEALYDTNLYDKVQKGEKLYLYKKILSNRK